MFGECVAISGEEVDVFGEKVAMFGEDCPMKTGSSYPSYPSYPMGTRVWASLLGA
jgi:hypothetical protein